MNPACRPAVRSPRPQPAIQRPRHATFWQQLEADPVLPWPLIIPPTFWATPACGHAINESAQTRSPRCRPLNRQRDRISDIRRPRLPRPRPVQSRELIGGQGERYRAIERLRPFERPADFFVFCNCFHIPYIQHSCEIVNIFIEFVWTGPDFSDILVIRQWGRVE